MFLVNSIRTSIGDSVKGDPSGTKWDKTLLNFSDREYITILIHITSPIGNTIEICEFMVNKVGIIEIKFVIKININSGLKNVAVKLLADNVLISV